MGRAKILNLNNKTFYMILKELNKNSNNAYNLAKVLPKSQPVIYRALNDLRELNLILPCDTGKNFYKINRIELNKVVCFELTKLKQQEKYFSELL